MEIESEESSRIGCLIEGMINCVKSEEDSRRREKKRNYGIKPMAVSSYLNKKNFSGKIGKKLN